MLAGLLRCRRQRRARHALELTGERASRRPLMCPAEPRRDMRRMRIGVSLLVDEDVLAAVLLIVASGHRRPASAKLVYRPRPMMM